VKSEKYKLFQFPNKEFLCKRLDNIEDIFIQWRNAGVPEARAIESIERIQNSLYFKPSLIFEAKPWHMLEYDVNAGLFTFYYKPDSARKTRLKPTQYLSRFFSGNGMHPFREALGLATNKGLSIVVGGKKNTFPAIYTKYMRASPTWAWDEPPKSVNTIGSSCLRYRAGESIFSVFKKHPTMAYGYGDIHICATRFLGETFCRTMFQHKKKKKGFSKVYWYASSEAESGVVQLQFRALLGALGVGERNFEALNGARLLKIRGRRTDDILFSEYKCCKAYICPYIDDTRYVSVLKDYIEINTEIGKFQVSQADGLVSSIACQCYRCGEPKEEHEVLRTGPRRGLCLDCNKEFLKGE
jgi:hypothetical protein